MLTGAALAIGMSLPGFVFILLTSPAGVYLLTVVHAASVAYLVTLDSQRSAQILSFPLLAPLYAIAGAIGKTDSLVRYVSKLAASSAEPSCMKWPKQDNVIIVASIVVWIGLLITLFVLVNR